MNETKKALKKYGLDAQEINIYLHLLSRIESSAYKIAKELHIPRSTVYDKLDSLEEKRLVAASRINNVKHYTPESLNNFFHNLDEKREVMESIIPNLREISKNAELKKPRVHFYAGKQEMKIVWEEILNNYKQHKSPDMYVTSHSDLYKVFPRYFHDWTKRRIKHKIHANIIRPTSDTINVVEKSYDRTFKYADDKYLSNSQIITYGDKTSFFIFNTKNPKTIVIESKEVTDMFNRLLRFMWDHSEK